MTATTHKFQTIFRAIFQKHSLKTKVTLFTLFFSLISIWALSFYARHTLYNDMENTLGAQQFSTVSIIAAEINNGLNDRMKALEKSAALITPAMLGNAASMQTSIEEHVVLQMMFNGGIFVLLTDGTAIADFPLPTGRRGLNFMDRKYASGALKEGKTTIGSPVMGKALRSMLFSIATPIHDKEGKVIGALAGTIDLAKPNFLSRITDNNYGKTGGYLLIAPKIRTIVFATDKKRIMEVLPAIGINPFIDRAIDGWEGSGITRTPLGVEVLASTKGIPMSGWYVTGIMPTEEAFVPIQAMLQRLLVSTIFMTLLAISLVWWILKRQLEPIFAAIKTLTTLTDTDQYPQPLPITRQDEIGKLIGSFNSLLETLGQRGEALKESEEQYHLIFENATDGILIIQEALFSLVNPKGLTMLGYTFEELHNIPFIDLIHPNDREMVMERYQKRIKGETVPDYYTFRFINKNGNIKFVETNSVLISWQNRPTVLVFIRDITEQKILREAIIRSEKLSALGKLSAGLAHELRSPLTAISSYTQFCLEEPKLPTDLKNNLEMINSHVQRANQLIKDLLAFSKPAQIAWNPIDINNILSHTLRMARLEKSGSGILLETDFDPDLPLVQGDGGKISQVFFNIIMNAIEASSKGEKILAQSRYLVEESRVEITIIDNGPGIPKEYLKNIFDPFFTLKDDGTGLGLSIAHTIMEQHKGHIKATTGPEGIGARVSVVFPVNTRCPEVAG